MSKAKDFSMFDPELAAVVAAFPDMPFSKEVLPALRQALTLTADQVIAACPLIHEEISIPGPGGPITASIFRSKTGSASSVPQVNRPGIYYLHGGGMAIQDRFAGIEQIAQWIVESNAVCVTIEYRRAPENPAPAQLDDSYAGLKWMASHSRDLGIDPSRLMIAGFSAGGNLAAATALLARDKNEPKLYAQVLLAPMLDDTSSSGSMEQYDGIGTWQKEQNKIAWGWVLNGKAADKYNAPSRYKDLRGLPPTYIDVGGAEAFRDEDVAYAMRLLAAGVPTELHVWPGAFHGFDMLAPHAAVSKVALAARAVWVKRILGAKAAKL